VRPTLWLLGAAAVLVGALLWLDRGRPTTDEAVRRRTELAPGFDRTRARSLEVGGARLERAADGWWLAAPAPRERADDAAVEALLTAVEGAAVERRIAAPDRAALGLDRPRVTLAVDGLRLAVGADDASGRNVYVARADEPAVLVVERRLYQAAERPLEAWRSTRLVLAEAAQASSFSVGERELERRGGAWQLVRPIASRADGRSVEALLGALDRLRAQRRLDAAPGDAPLALALDGKIEARLDGACPGHAGERAAVRADGARLCFIARELDALEPTPSPSIDWLRERRLVPFSVDEVREIDLRAGVRRLRVVRQNATWQIVAPLEAAGPADEAAMREWLAALVAKEGEGFAAPAPPSVGLRVATASDAVELSLGTRGGRTLARRKGEPDALVLAPLGALVAPDPGRVKPGSGRASGSGSGL
jgi:hypothetical protein